MYRIVFLIACWTIVPVLLKQILGRRRNFVLNARPGYVNLETSALNEFIFQGFSNNAQDKSLRIMEAGMKHNYKKSSLFYNVGAIAAGICSIAGIATLSWNLLHVFTTFSTRTDTDNMKVSNIMIPLVPGVTMPMTPSYIVPLSLSVLISAGLHELGHAIACAKEDIRIHSMGAFLVAPFLCGAYVRLPVDIQALSPGGRLRVWSAGIWHNVLLCFVLSLILSTPFMSFFDFISSPLYGTGQGAVIVEVQSSGSPLYGHVDASDVFVGLNSHPVESVDQWYESIRDIASSSSSSGFCVNSEWISGDSTCCNDDDIDSNSKEESDDVMCFRIAQSDISANATCESVSSLSKMSKVSCSSENECKGDYECLFPDISQSERVVWIDISRGEDVSHSVYEHSFFFVILTLCLIQLETNSIEHRYVGDLSALWSGIILSDRKYRFSTFVTFFTLLPVYLDRTLNLTLAISASLAVLNAIPMYYLDGEHVFDSFFMLLMRHRKRAYYKTLICKWVLRCGTMLVLLNVLCSSFFFLRELLYNAMVKSNDDGML